MNTHPSTRSPRTLNRVSLSRSGVGRVLSPSTDINFRERNSPAITRISSNGRVLDAQLVQIRVELRRIVVERLHLRAILFHRLPVQPDRRFVGRTQQALV